MTFSDKVKRVRAKLQLSQAQLADKLNVSVVSVNRWESKGVEPQFLVRARFDEFCQENAIVFEDTNV